MFFPRIIQIQDIRIKEGWLFGFYVNIDALSIHLLSVKGSPRSFLFFLGEVTCLHARGVGTG